MNTKHDKPVRGNVGVSIEELALRTFAHRVQAQKHLPKQFRCIERILFLFNGGNVEKTFFMSHLQLDEAEFEHIRHPQQGQCIYKCGNDRYLLKVVAPEYKSELFGAGGGK